MAIELQMNIDQHRIYGDYHFRWGKCRDLSIAVCCNFVHFYANFNCRTITFCTNSDKKKEVVQ